MLEALFAYYDIFLSKNDLTKCKHYANISISTWKGATLVELRLKRVVVFIK